MRCKGADEPQASFFKRSRRAPEIESRFFEDHFKHRHLGDAHSQPLTGSALHASQVLETKRTRSKGIDRSRQHSLLDAGAGSGDSRPAAVAQLTDVLRNSPAAEAAIKADRVTPASP